jgi:hypothetical protein
VRCWRADLAADLGRLLLARADLADVRFCFPLERLGRDTGGSSAFPAAGRAGSSGGEAGGEGAVPRAEAGEGEGEAVPACSEAGPCILAHSQILSARSDVFSALLAPDGGWRVAAGAGAGGDARARVGVVDLPVTYASAAAFRMLLLHLYTGDARVHLGGEADEGGGEGGEGGEGEEGDGAGGGGGPRACSAQRLGATVELLGLACMHLLPRLQAQCATVLGRAVKLKPPKLKPGARGGGSGDADGDGGGVVLDAEALEQLHDLCDLYGGVLQGPLQGLVRERWRWQREQEAGEAEEAGGEEVGGEEAGNAGEHA